MLKWQNNAKHNINQPTDFHRFPLQHGWPGQPAQRASKTGSGRAHVALMSGEEGPTCNQHLIVFCCCRKLTRKQTRKPGVCTPHCSEKWGIGISNACFLEVLRGTMWNPNRFDGEVSPLISTWWNLRLHQPNHQPWFPAGSISWIPTDLRDAERVVHLPDIFGHLLRGLSILGWSNQCQDGSLWSNLLKHHIWMLICWMFQECLEGMFKLYIYCIYTSVYSYTVINRWCIISIMSSMILLVETISSSV